MKIKSYIYNIKIKRMNINNIKELIEETKDYSKSDQILIAENLPIFDACNYVIWLEKIYNIKISL